MTDRAGVENAVRGRTGEVASADIVQETWLKLANHPSDSAIENPSAFVRRVAKNSATDYLRKERRRSALNTEVHDLLYDTEDELSPERLVIGRQAAECATPSIHCPSSDELRLFRGHGNGGSGSSGFEVRRPAGDAASVFGGWSGV
ncbi:RNA polymerase sigma factor [Nitrobacter winogradskyi]|nr:sigma factor [Nitrobacter winogradskyi]